MNTAEQILESYCRFVKKWYTMSNVVCGNAQKELDILAIDRENNMKYHIECSVTITDNFQPTADFFQKKDKEKFEDMRVKKFIQQELAWESWGKIWVCWKIDHKNRQQALDACQALSIEVWELRDKILELFDVVGTPNYDDPVLRTLQLLKIAQREKKVKGA